MNDFNYNYMPELSKLATGLVLRGIPFEFKPVYNGGQILVHNALTWDVICHSGSYGHNCGLLELMGDIVLGGDDVEGWLTAEDILCRL